MPKLLRQVELKAKLDLINLCTPGESLTPAVLKHRSRLADASAGGASAEDGVDGGGGPALPHLHLPSSPINIDEQSLRELAFEIFLHSCGSNASASLAESLRNQLEVRA